MTIVAAYVRVFSQPQKHDSQKAEVERWLTANGFDMAQVRWYADVETGTKLQRPAMDQLQKDIFAGTVRTVVCWKLDRISRRLKDGLNLLSDWCERGVRIVAVTQQIDLSGALGRMVAAIMLGLAEIEWEYRKERQTAGIAVAKKHGVYKGRKAGTTKNKPERARELRDRGLTADEIATALGISERTVFRYLGRVAA
jgi:DNA invertase Pin-like site-specific DNA recombinase